MEDEKTGKMHSASSDIGRPASCLFPAESSIFIHQSAKICWKDRGTIDEEGGCGTLKRNSWVEL